MRWLRRLTSGGLPDGFAGELDAEENVLAVSSVEGGGHLVATSHGLWLSSAESTRFVGWHLVSRATWGAGVLTLVEAKETRVAGAAVLLADQPPVRLVLAEPGKLPDVVNRRVTGSIRSRHHHDLPGGGAWFVQRKVAGRDGYLLQVRVDEGTDPELVARIAEDVAQRAWRV